MPLQAHLPEDVAIKKVPASPELVKGNKLYSLEGAQYGPAENKGDAGQEN